MGADCDNVSDAVGSPDAHKEEVCHFFFQIIEVTKKITAVKDKAFLVLISLAVYAERYVEYWSTFFGKELKLKLKEAEAVGARLVAVLEVALELCIEPQVKLSSNKSVWKFLKPSAGEFIEIVDDFRRYTQMMNRLITRVIRPEKTSAKSAERMVRLICHLQHKVELDCSLLNSTIERDFKNKKYVALDSPIAWDNLDVDTNSESKFLDSSIRKAYVQNLPVLLREVKTRERESLKAQIDMAMQLQHVDSSHITRLIGHSENEDGRILIFEDMEGDWAQLGSGNYQFSEPVVIDMMMQCAKGMKRLYQNHDYQHDGWLYPRTVFFKPRSNGTYLVKIDHIATADQETVSVEQDDVSRFVSFGRCLYNDLPHGLMEVLDNCEASDSLKRPSFANICEQLWVVMEEVLTGSVNLKQGLMLEELNAAEKNAIFKDTLLKTDDPENIIDAVNSLKVAKDVGVNVDITATTINIGTPKTDVTEIMQLKVDVTKMAVNVDELKIDGDRMKQLLSELGESTRKYLCWDANKQGIVASLTSINSFSGNDQIKKQVVDDYPFSSSLKPQDEPLFPREEMIKELEGLLLNSNGPKIIAVHGIGGTGKTRTVQMLVDRSRLRSYFQISWHTVGRNSKMQAIERKIEDILSFGVGCQVKRLFILDDVWENEEVSYVQKMSQCSELRFLITTQQVKLIEACKSIHPVPIQLLSEVESWDLFKYHAFPFCTEEDIPPSLKNLAKNAAKKCKGHPLVLQVIGRAMSDKKTELDWNDAQVKLKDPKIIDDEHVQLMRVLRLSYDALESKEKNIGKIRECFLYFGAFKEDEEISIFSLMNCWVGEGLIKADQNPVYQTYIILGVLIGNSLIERGMENRCKIHNVLRDLTFHISKEKRPCQDLFQAAFGQQTTEIEYDRLLRISWRCTLVSLSEIKASNLKVLLLDNSSVSIEFLVNSLPSLSSLQVLSLENSKIKSLPDSLGQLQCLVALNLAGSKIEHIPDSLGNLRELKILDLRYCERLRKLPKNAFPGLKNLQVLRFCHSYHVGFDYNEEYNEAEGEFEVKEKEREGKEDGEEELYLKCFTDEGASEFQNLTELTWFTFRSKVLPANIENMTKLTILEIRCPITNLEPLRRLDKLERLVLVDCMLTELPQWICNIPSLRHLIVTTRDPSADYLPDFSPLPRLQKLRIEGWQSLVSFPKSLEQTEGLQVLNLTNCNILSLERCGSFPELKELLLIQCDIEKLPEAQAFPKVQLMTIRNLYQKTEIPMSWALPASLNYLTLLFISCSGVKFPREIHEGALPSLEGLSINADVEEFPEVEKGALPALQVLRIRGLKGSKIPDSLWHFLDGLAKQLRRLELGSNYIASLEEWGSAYVPSELRLAGSKLKRLPASMGVEGSPFQSLQTLRLEYCKELELEDLPEIQPFALPCLREVTVFNCSKFKITSRSWWSDKIRII